MTDQAGPGGGEWRVVEPTATNHVTKTICIRVLEDRGGLVLHEAHQRGLYVVAHRETYGVLVVSEDLDILRAAYEHLLGTGVAWDAPVGVLRHNRQAEQEVEAAQRWVLGQEMGASFGWGRGGPS